MKSENFPLMAKIRQKFETTPVKDIRKKVAEEFIRANAAQILKAGQTVAVTSGSRGVSNIAEITRAIVDELRKLGTKPFIVPAMGSHGGATAEGQRKVLAGYGIDEKTMGVEVRSSMDVVALGPTDDGVPVFIDKNASEADHIIAVNRIKPHTDYEAPHESGVVKMLAIGLGKQHAADLYHNLFVQQGHYPVLASVARKILKASPISFGIGIIENQLEQTDDIIMMRGEDIFDIEHELLKKAKRLLPRIPFDNFDILVVDEMGKTISGTGMDQNIIGRSVIPYHVVPDTPKISRIYVRDLTDDSGGNALGIGNADFTTNKLVNKINRQVTYMNTFTANSPEFIRIPPSFDTDREVLDLCYRTSPALSERDLRIIHIKNTLELEYMLVSDTLLDEIDKNSAIELVSKPAPYEFDTEGNFLNLF